MEPFRLGELVALNEAAVDTRGHVVGLSEDARLVQVRWDVCPGYEDQVTTENAELLRRVHESEEGMTAA
jgi:hypothetical protein